MKWTVVFTKQARKDAKKLSASGLQPKVEALVEILWKNPCQTPPHYEKLCDAVTAPKRIWPFETAGHNTMPVDPHLPWWRELVAFISS